MKEIVFLLEEASAKAMIQIILPKICTITREPRYVVFEGKQDMEKQLLRKLRGYNNSEAVFIILRDQDSSECYIIKNKLKQICNDAGRPDSVVRIACRELESWYLADLLAVERAYDIRDLSAKQMKAKYRNPDLIVNPAKELKKMVSEYQKIHGSRQIANFLDLDNTRSKSFHHFIQSIKSALSE